MYCTVFSKTIMILKILQFIVALFKDVLKFIFLEKNILETYQIL